MKNLIHYLVLSLILLSCKSTKEYHQVPNIGIISENKGEVILKAVTENNTKGIEEAQKSAIKTILFKGIANSSSLNVPLVANESQSLAEYKDYYDNLLNKGFYKTFILSSQESGVSKNPNGKNKLVLVMKINVNALRRDLEQHSVIRKFGF